MLADPKWDFSHTFLSEISHNFLSEISKHLISISIQYEAQPLNPDEADHLSFAQLKQQKQKSEGGSRNGHK